MKKLVVLTIGLVGVLLSGCGSNYKCDSKEYAESALNLLLFQNSAGSGDKDLTYQSLGFEISDDIMLAKLDKANKQSICKVQVSNKFVTQLAKDLRSGNLRQIMQDKSKNKSENLQMVTGLMGDISIMYLAFDFYDAIYKNNEEVDYNEAQALAGMAVIAAKVAVDGISYRVFDNGNGDIMINVDKVK